MVLHQDHLLFAEGYDDVKEQTFYRALGGAIEFGEIAADAVVRELAEETGRRIELRGSLGVVENRFTYRGYPGHEIVFEYVASFAPDDAPPGLDPITCHEGDGQFVAVWLPLAEVLGGLHHVYPEGLPGRLAGWINTL